MIGLSPFTSSMSAVRPFAKHGRCLRESSPRAIPNPRKPVSHISNMGASTSLGLEPDWVDLRDLAKDSQRRRSNTGLLGNL
jgi:hypothetical protein